MPANHGRAGSINMPVGAMDKQGRRITVALNPQNLQPVRTKDEARERGRAGGKASGEKRRERKSLREALLLILNEPMRDEKGHFTGGTMQDEMVAALIKRANTGDPRAFELIRDTIGEKPEDNVNVRAGDFKALDAAFAQMRGDRQ